MKTTLTALSAIALAAASVMTVGTSAQARDFGRGYYHHGGYHHGGYYRHGGYGRGYDRGYYRHHHGNGAAIGAGILGLGVGALIGGALANSYNEPGYYEPAPRYYEPAPRYYEPAPVYVAPRPLYRVATPVYGAAPAYGSVRVQARTHAAACAARYRSYDPRSDTFLGYDGYRHRCNAY